MKKIAILFVSIFVFSISFANAANDENGTAESSMATTSVSGKVLDKITGEALAGVKVSIQGTEKSVYTDFDGNFEIDGVRPGNRELTASYISYKEKTENFSVDLSKAINVDVMIESIVE
ncbi:MAG TPA: TonB-dependent receptor [Bacteroidales bacterium]|jgi:hypothetical protein|nr:TonB-dependent receptor [Bacteroidales bacterium]